MSLVNQEALSLTLLPELKREFSLSEVAVMTRSAAAELLGLNDRGHLAPGAIADIAVYDPDKFSHAMTGGQAKTDYQAMFADAVLLFKNGQRVVQDGVVINKLTGLAQTIAPHYDQQIIHTVQNHFDRFYSLKLSNFGVDEADFDYLKQSRFREIAL